MLFKHYNDASVLDRVYEDGVVRLGSLNYYKTIECKYRNDGCEGSYHYQSPEFSVHVSSCDEFFVFSMTKLSDEKTRNKFGNYSIQISDAEELGRRIKNTLLQIGFRLKMDPEIVEVEYEDNPFHDDRNNIRDWESTFSKKGLCFKEEEEVRIIINLKSLFYFQSPFIDLKIDKIQEVINLKSN